jgi:hypothetical protein
LLTTTVSASVATVNSTGSIPLSAHDSSSSLRMAREALLKSVRPGQKWLANPPPEPVDWRLTSTWEWSDSNRSAIAVASGNTVELPATSMGPERPSPSSPSSPPSPDWVHPARPAAPTAPAVATNVRRDTPRADVSSDITDHSPTSE